PEGSFDLAYSSLTFHYIKNLERLFTTIHRALVPDGRLVFSIEHPIYMAPNHPEWMGGTDGRERWPLDGYLAEGPRRAEWLGSAVVKQHRTIGTTLNVLIGVGFVISHIEEWGPTVAQIEAHPEWAKERERPMF